MSSRTLTLTQVALPRSGLLLSLLGAERGDGAVWELTRPGESRALLHIGATGPNLLGGGYAVQTPTGQAAVALGHVQLAQPPSLVRFTSARLRWREEATARTCTVDDLWIAEARGGFDLVVVPGDESAPDHVARLQLLR